MNKTVEDAKYGPVSIEIQGKLIVAEYDDDVVVSEAIYSKIKQVDHFPNHFVSILFGNNTMMILSLDNKKFSKIDQVFYDHNTKITPWFDNLLIYLYSENSLACKNMIIITDCRYWQFHQVPGNTAFDRIVCYLNYIFCYGKESSLYFCYEEGRLKHVDFKLLLSQEQQLSQDYPFQVGLIEQVLKIISQNTEINC